MSDKISLGFDGQFRHTGATPGATPGAEEASSAIQNHSTKQTISVKTAFKSGPTLEEQLAQMQADGTYTEPVSEVAPVDISNMDPVARAALAWREDPDVVGFASEEEMYKAMSATDELGRELMWDPRYAGLVLVKAQRMQQRTAPKVDHVSGLEMTNANVDAITRANIEASERQRARFETDPRQLAKALADAEAEARKVNARLDQLKRLQERVGG